MVKIITIGRTDLKDLWEKSDVLTSDERKFYPFLVFEVKEEEVHVLLEKKLTNLLYSNLPDNTKIMVQWQGEWRSDFFQFTLEELKNAFERRYGTLKLNEINIEISWRKMSEKQFLEFYEKIHLKNTNDLIIAKKFGVSLQTLKKKLLKNYDEYKKIEKRIN